MIDRREFLMAGGTLAVAAPVTAFPPSAHRGIMQTNEEGGHRRRMMSVSAHDRIAGRPARMRVLKDFIQYAQSHPAVTFMRKVDIANYAIKHANRSRGDLGATG